MSRTHCLFELNRHHTPTPSDFRAAHTQLPLPDQTKNFIFASCQSKVWKAYMFKVARYPVLRSDSNDRQLAEWVRIVLDRSPPSSPTTPRADRKRTAARPIGRTGTSVAKTRMQLSRFLFQQVQERSMQSCINHSPTHLHLPVQNIKQSCTNFSFFSTHAFQCTSRQDSMKANFRTRR